MQTTSRKYFWSGIWAFFITFCVAFPTFFYPISYDQATFMYIGRIWQDGLLPFRDALDTKPPGIFAMYAIADLIFGRAEISYRILECIFITSTILPLIYIFRQMNMRKGGFLAHFLYIFIYYVGTDFTNIGQVEMVIANTSIWFLAFVLHQKQKGTASIIASIFAGMISGLLFLLKQPFAIVALIYFSIFLKRLSLGEIKTLFEKNKIQLFAFIGGGILSICLVILYFLYNNAIYDLFYGMLQLPYYYSKHSGLPVNSFWDYASTLIWNLPIVLIILSSIYYLIRQKDSTERIVIIWAAILILAVIIQRKYWPYHFIAILPVLAIFITYGLYKCLFIFNKYLSLNVAKVLLSSVLVIEGIFLAMQSYQINVYGLGSSSSYVGALQNTIQYLQKNINKTQYYATYYGGFVRADTDWIFSKKILEYIKPEESLQIVEFRPSLYIYTNTKAKHKYFFGSILFLVGPNEGKRMLREYEIKTYKTNRPDWIVFGLDGPWLMNTILPLHPAKHGYTLIDTFESNYHPNNPIKKVTFGIFKNNLLK